jgi:hypothetical protein
MHLLFLKLLLRNRLCVFATDGVFYAYFFGIPEKYLFDIRI